MELELEFAGTYPGAGNQGSLRTADSESSSPLGITHHLHRADKGIFLFILAKSSTTMVTNECDIIAVC